MPLTGVAGWPVDHSRSPALHSAAFDELGLKDWRSQLLPIPPDLFAETVRALPDSGFAGINVTIPHKEAALILADRASDTAAACGAANTLSFVDGSIEADNTDVPAIESIASEMLADPRQTSVLVLGAGGTARAALLALARLEVARVEVWNRTHQRAVELCSELGGVAVHEPGSAQLLLNTTSVGLGADAEADLAALPVGPEELSGIPCVLDLVYRSGGSPLGNLARNAGAEVIDGLEVLVRQGALSLERWTGRRPSLEVLRRAVAD